MYFIIVHGSCLGVGNMLLIESLPSMCKAMSLRPAIKLKQIKTQNQPVSLHHQETGAVCRTLFISLRSLATSVPLSLILSILGFQCLWTCQTPSDLRVLADGLFVSIMIFLPLLHVCSSSCKNSISDRTTAG